MIYLFLYGCVASQHFSPSLVDKAHYSVRLPFERLETWYWNWYLILKTWVSRGIHATSVAEWLQGCTCHMDICRMVWWLWYGMAYKINRWTAWRNTSILHNHQKSPLTPHYNFEQGGDRYSIVIWSHCMLCTDRPMMGQWAWLVRFWMNDNCK